ncbi:MAG: zinc ribbon domain-containing protein [Clostridia bacterium]|nr:zinc ribbon domain-containing protein [Clostridia bacterium]
MGITENAAYLKGLFEGYEIDTEKKEGKIIGKMLDLIADMADKIAALEADNKELHEYVEELDHDLGEVEEEVYFYDEDEDYEDDDEEDYEDEDDSEYYELECPSCGEVVCFDDSLDPDELVCPACGEKIGEIEICDGECDSCDEDCESKK